jgi:DNA sulfur modification protein DndC
VTIIYCDTKVENPILDSFVKQTLKDLRAELRSINLNIKVKILTPALHQRYFRVIGRGYPPPTTFFRWCTTDLRIRPVQHFIRKADKKALVVIGTRRGESIQRDRVIKRANIWNRGPVIQEQMENSRQTSLYLPIANYAVQDVWETLAELPTLKSIDVFELAALYRQGGGECPTIRDTNDQPCASARFGCWVCTVVRRDRSTENLLKAGFNDLKPYYEFRSWLSEIRNEPSRHCARRRNGSNGLGPFTLATRRLLLRRVRQLEKTVRQTLITEKEEQTIRALWRADQCSPEYAAMERKRHR